MMFITSFHQDGSEAHPWIPETYVVEAPSGGDFKALKKAYEAHLQGMGTFDYGLLGLIWECPTIYITSRSFHFNS